MHDLLAEINSPILDDIHRIGIVLAAGHGKRIRSETSKMLHEIWGQPTAVRVARAVQEGLDSPNQVIIVGIKGRGRRPCSRPPTGASFRVPRKPGPSADQPEPVTPCAASASKLFPCDGYRPRRVHLFRGHGLVDRAGCHPLPRQL